MLVYGVGRRAVIEAFEREVGDEASMRAMAWSGDTVRNSFVQFAECGGKIGLERQQAGRAALWEREDSLGVEDEWSDSRRGTLDREDCLGELARVDFTEEEQGEMNLRCGNTGAGHV